MERVDEILRHYWGYSAFRPYQREIIESACAGHDTLALLATGGGKSITYQVSGLARGGLTLVISPLIALMEDQVQGLKSKGIRAAAVHSGLGMRRAEERLDNCIHGQFSFLYISPERLATSAFRDRLRALDVRLLAVDEAHCISQWGFDFRPAYREIALVREELPEVPILAVTATATPPVVQDICEQLQFHDAKIFNAGFARPNLSYCVRHCDNTFDSLLQMVRQIEGSGIVYGRTRMQTHMIQNMLRASGIECALYHAGLSSVERTENQERWMRGESRLMAATNAFGMGIDKSDTRFVIHLGFPATLEEYYQEAGRAGRDGKPAHALILYDRSDLFFARRRMSYRFPNVEMVQRIYSRIISFLGIGVGEGASQPFAFPLERFAMHFEERYEDCLNAISFMERMGILEVVQPRERPVQLRVTAPMSVLNQYRRANEQYDRIFQYLLGRYPEITRSLVEISLVETVRELRLVERVLLDLLVTAARSGLIELQVQDFEKQIVFKESRGPRTRLPLDVKLAEQAYARESKRLESILSYVEGSSECRDVTLRGYFGEGGVAPCGRCDVCLAQVEPEFTEERERALRADIMAELAGDVVPIDDIVARHFDQHDEVLNILRRMIMRGEVVCHAGGRISLL